MLVCFLRRFLPNPDATHELSYYIADVASRDIVSSFYHYFWLARNCLPTAVAFLHLHTYFALLFLFTCSVFTISTDTIWPFVPSVTCCPTHSPSAQTSLIFTLVLVAGTEVDWAWSGCHKLDGTKGWKVKAATWGGVLTPLLTFRRHPSSVTPPPPFSPLFFLSSVSPCPLSRIPQAVGKQLVPGAKEPNNKRLVFSSPPNLDDFNMSWISISIIGLCDLCCFPRVFLCRSVSLIVTH